jgi:hypothetical protein|tara:strand:+ start:1085 stop:1816 length:732 start_codon:yes stop_codon:yes gene_type:complete
MKDILQDIVAHTHALGFLNIVKVNGDDAQTGIDSMAEDRSVILQATTKAAQVELKGTFGMPNLNKLDIHLKCPEYKDGASIDVVTAERNGATIPVGIHFENATKDFKNDYRFMNAEIINEKLKTVKFKGASWDVEVQPTMAAIQRFKLQATANAEETVFTVMTDSGDLKFKFGDASTHAGEFVFQPGITGQLKNEWAWPVAQVLAVLGLNGDKTMRISDQGAMQISVDSGLATYDYIMPAQSK